MIKHCCSFLENNFSDINEKVMDCEKHLVNENYVDSIFMAGKVAEDIAKEICEFEKLYSLKTESHSTIVYALLNKKIITKDIFSDFQDILLASSADASEELFEIKTKAAEVHEEIFEISVFFYKNYQDKNFIAPEYNGPIMQKTKIFRGAESVENSADALKDYPFDTYKGSYLYNELYKLSDASNESVDSDELSYFKNYLHVDRSIQTQFIQEVNRVENFDSSHLIILSGSTGDGKSHLLACLKSEKPNLYDNFKVIRDATESYDQDKDAYDTLASQLTPFNDRNISQSTDKMIFLINLGVLNNFLNSDYTNYSKFGDESYSKLKEKLIDEYKIFDSKSISHNILREKVSFLTFVDYNCFELNDNPKENYSSSNFISSIFKKITSGSEKNPIYAAYQKDKKRGYDNPLIYNYEMFMDSDVQNILISYLIKIFVKYKVIVSTRDILNFVYEILVPLENLSKTNLKQNIVFIDNLLPNLLFNTEGRSKLLNLFKEFDPVLHRNEFIDDFITDVNINKDIYKVFNDFNMDKLKFLRTKLEEIELKPNSEKTDEENKDTLHEYTNFLIRLSLFYGNSNLKQGFNDEIYNDFMKYLYFCNDGNKTEYKKLFNEIKGAIFKWKGSNKKDYICVDELKSFKVFKELRLNSLFRSQNNNELNDFDQNRFRNYIRICSFVKGSDKKVDLDLDYTLYGYIKRLNSGFKPNKSNKEDLRLLDEFISDLLPNGDNNYLIINSLKKGINFELEFDDEIETYEFRRI